MKLDLAKLAERKKILEEASKQLKSEFFGLDLIIDKVINAVYAWYVFPELIKRPVIVNLWGMTGVGKTALVRRVSSLLNFSNKFVEIQMDGTSGGSGFRKDSISSILSNCIDEGEAGILLLDEIQRFRTVGAMGEDVKVERFQDVWMLLSDGRFSANSELFSELEMMIAYSDYQKDNINDDVEDEDDVPATDKKITKKERKFKLYPYEAKMLKKLLRLPESVSEIMTWDSMKIESLIRDIKNTRTSWEVDYSKLLVFVSGNLDYAFQGSTNTEDCDTDADFYHEITKKITTSAIKDALSGRFKPEQIARLGNNHIIYPSMSKVSYQQLIKSTCDKYIQEMNELSDINFTLDDKALGLIYLNSVYPTQGTRPVFSSVHKIFSTPLVTVTCWCLENAVSNVYLEIDAERQKLIAYDNDSKLMLESDIELEITDRRSKATKDFKTLVAVHEAGHALAYAMLTHSAPLETKINTTSFSGGFMLPNDELNDNNITTKKDLRDKIAVLLAGTVAEEIIFGPDNRSTGCGHDLTYATAQASLYVRQVGFDGTLSTIDGVSTKVTWNTNLADSNAVIETLLRSEYDRVKALITNNFQFYRKIVDELLEHGTVDQKMFIALAKEFTILTETSQNFDFSNQYTQYTKNRKVKNE